MKTLVVASVFSLFAESSIADISPMICEGTMGTSEIPISLSVAGESGVFMRSGETQFQDLNCHMKGSNLSCVWAIGSADSFLTTVLFFVQTDIQRVTQVLVTKFSGGDLGDKTEQRIHTSDDFSCR